jgi:hypothetical protein
MPFAVGEQCRLAPVELVVGNGFVFGPVGADYINVPIPDLPNIITVRVEWLRDDIALVSIVSPPGSMGALGLVETKNLHKLVGAGEPDESESDD